MQNLLKQPCVIYVRTPEFNTKLSTQKNIEIQVAACKKYISNFYNNDDASSSCYKTYVDISDGNIIEREGLKALFKDIELKKIKTVIIYKLDILATSIEIFSEILKLFVQQEVGVIPVFNLDNEFISVGNPKYTIKDRTHEEAVQSQLLQLAKKYLYISDIGVKGSLLSGIVQCKNCNTPLTESEEDEYKTYVCKSCCNVTVSIEKCEIYVVAEVRKLLREAALTGMVPWKLKKLGLTHKQAFTATQNLDKIWNILPRNEMRRIIGLIVKNVFVGNESKISITFRNDVIETILDEIKK